MAEGTLEIPQEVTQKIEAIGPSVKGMTKEQLLAEAARLGETYKPDEANEGFLRRKVAKLLRSEIMKEAGLSEAQAAPAAVVAEGDASAEKKKTGRKKMDRSGAYKIHLLESQSPGREGSTKYKIVVALREKAAFDYNEFRAVVAEAMGWERDEPGKFAINSKFADLDKATAAWFSELKNKQEIVIPVQGN